MSIIEPIDFMPRSAWLCFGVKVGWTVVDDAVVLGEVALSVVDEDEIVVDVEDRWSGTSRRSLDRLVDLEVVMIVLMILDVGVDDEGWADVAVSLAVDVKIDEAETDEVGSDEADELVGWDETETRVEAGVEDELEMPCVEEVRVDDDPLTLGPREVEFETDELELDDTSVEEGDEPATDSEVAWDEDEVELE